MNVKRFIVVLSVLFAMSLGFNGVWAADYPSKPINFLIPFGPGSGADLMGRTLASGAEKYLGQPIVPVNKPGAAGGIMYSALKAARPDGYTVGWNSLSILTTTNIGNVPFKYDAFDQVCMIGYTAMPIAVRSDAPWKTFQEFAAYAKANPGKIKIGNAGTGSGTHLTAVLMAKELKLKVIHVPLGAQRRVPSLLGGEVQAICVPLPEIASQVQSGQVRILLMNTEKRSPMFPDVPTLKELGCPVLVELFRGISVPKGTPKPIIQKLAAAFEKGAQSPDFQKLAKKNGFDISFLGAEKFQKYLKAQNEVVAEALKLGGLIK
jgi:tripartite-type tricarboxylate transporter receptor subunit TctC